MIVSIEPIAATAVKAAGTTTSTTLWVAIAGIAVSGVVGPGVTSWATRRANKQQFERDQNSKQREDLRTVVDDAAKLLGAGVTNLRITREVRQAGREEPEEIAAWASDVHLLRQRLLLRRASADAVVVSFGAVLSALQSVGTAVTDAEYKTAIDEYKNAMDAFLSAARAALMAPVA
jgi:hypothetical protein